MLAAPGAGILLAGITRSKASINPAREAQGLLQFIVPLCLAAIVQWFPLRRYLRQAA